MHCDPEWHKVLSCTGSGHPTCTDSVLVTISNLNCRQGKVYAIEAKEDIHDAVKYQK